VLLGPLARLPRVDAARVWEGRTIHWTGRQTGEVGDFASVCGVCTCRSFAWWQRVRSIGAADNGLLAPGRKLKLACRQTMPRNLPEQDSNVRPVSLQTGRLWAPFRLPRHQCGHLARGSLP